MSTVIKETITFTFQNEEQQRRFHERLEGGRGAADFWCNDDEDEAVSYDTLEDLMSDVPYDTPQNVTGYDKVVSGVAVLKRGELKFETDEDIAERDYHDRVMEELSHDGQL